MASKYDVAGLIEALGYQKQCDPEGIMCEVSRQAVDEAIALLRQYHEALRNPWIRVEDRLPESGFRVLTYGYNSVGNYHAIENHRFSEHDKQWVIGNSYEVTHWMPLPPEPTNE